ncbi:polysaccharide pyruvyl transferase family protein [Cellulomonas sp. ATA003]|uniref:polysaccharide pyruvyl transferase family protein n=1 Tax=Cellulomonas sp. ATA003 TaxID=3073064 RepID=UPI002872AE50|nr:polysaccharide pyruvyl transferase family protein [Cellulomonas sp. ATA003]WNB85081.1 polysaccharide pyruvyl transferase family protein [Cellulomonas sp. ATA003]
MLDLAAGLLESGRHLTLLAHVLDSPVADNDVPAVREAAQVLDSPSVDVVIPTSLDDVRDVTGSAALVIGSRMHACLNALSTGTPAIPLAYSRKFDPLLRDLGWRHTIDLRHADDPVGAALRLASADLGQDVADVVGRADELLEPAVAALGAL